MSRPQDLFPARLERKLGMFERLDPVVHTPEERLADGPLSTGQVREFDERGFVFFDSFFSKDEMDGFIKELKDYKDENSIEAPKPRSNLFFVYNSVHNTLEEPYCGNKPRPEFLANRKNLKPLRPV